jgi:hypothetical protein
MVRPLLWPLFGLLAVLTAAGAVAAWQFRHSLGWAERGADAAGARKCVRNGQVVYTNAACPPGSRELGIAGGTLTVVKSNAVAAAGAPTAPTASASGAPTVRDLLLDPKAANLKEQRIEAVIGR